MKSDTKSSSRYRLLQFLSLCAATFLLSLGFHSPELVAASTEQVKKITDAGTVTPLSRPYAGSIESHARKVSQEITVKIVEVVQDAFKGHYGTFRVVMVSDGLSSDGKTLIFHLERSEKDAGLVNNFDASILITKVGELDREQFKKAIARWDSELGVVIDFKDQAGKDLITESYLDINPLLKPSLK